MAVVDIFDALTTDRPYREAMTSEDAFVILEEEATENELDPEIVAALKEMVSAAEPSGRRAGDSKTSEKPKILVIDHDPLNVKLIRALLQGRYEVLSESRGDAGIETARRVHPGLILIDLLLPGKAAIATARQIRKDIDLRETPILVMSADERREEIEEALVAGCARYITKPIDTRQFVAAIEEYIYS